MLSFLSARTLGRLLAVTMPLYFTWEMLQAPFFTGMPPDWALAINGALADSPLVKDSVDGDGHMGSAVVKFTAHKPGDWLLHCHKPMHMDGGMISLVKVG